MGNIVKYDALVPRPLILRSLIDLALDNRLCEFLFPKASACFGCCVKKNSRSFPVDDDVNFFLVKIVFFFENARCQEYLLGLFPREV